jgi:hypothetical protein
MQPEPGQGLLELGHVRAGGTSPQRPVGRKVPGESDDGAAGDLEEDVALGHGHAHLRHPSGNDRRSLEPAGLETDVDRTVEGGVAPRHHLALQGLAFHRNGDRRLSRRLRPGSRLRRRDDL